MPEPYDQKQFGQNTPAITDEDLAQVGQDLELDPLTLQLDEKDFIDTTKHLIEESRKFFEKRGLYKRRAKNEEYYLGKQIDRLEERREFSDYSVRYLDNLVWESEAMLKPIALSRVPDLIVLPGTEKDESKEAADEITDVINSRLRKRENRTVLGRTYKHRPIYFIGCIKYMWDKEKGRYGDYKFENIHPKQIDVDHTNPDNETENMGWIAHHYDMNLKQIFMRFPDKKTEYMKKMGYSENAVKKEKFLATRRAITEVWFTWYSKVSEEWEKVEGTAWLDLDKKFLFKKIKNPNWDWKGEKILIKYDEEAETAEELDEAGLREMFVSGESMENVKQQTIYNNYFESPRKPFILVGYDQLGMQPYDETSRIEQVVYLQDNVNKRGKQISEIADHARGKNVFSTESGLTSKDVEQIDMLNPEQDILVDGKVGDVWSLIPGVQPNEALFKDQELTRERVFAKMGAHATTRGEREADETATGRQILREADFTKQDDEVEDTINYAAEKMAEAAMQMIKLRYTKNHLFRLLGDNSEMIMKSLNQDLVEDGMEVQVSASATDKMRRKREAYELAKITMIDPLSFYEDIEKPDPKGRAERLLQFTLSPPNYYSKYILEEDTVEGQANALGMPPPGGAPQPGQPGQPAGQGQGVQQLSMDIAQLEQGQKPQVPQQMSPEYINGFNEWLKTPAFQQLPPEIQQLATDFAKEISQAATQ